MGDDVRTLAKCGFDQADFLIGQYSENGGCHVESLVGATGALLGGAIQNSAIFKVMNRGLEPVTMWETETNPPFNGFVNCLSRLRPFVERDFNAFVRLTQMMEQFPLDALPDIMAIISHNTQSLSAEWFPVLTVPHEHYPHEWSPNAVSRHGDHMRAIVKHHGLTDDDAEVISLLLALGRVVELTREVVPPKIGLQLGFEMAIATASMRNLDKPIHFNGPPWGPNGPGGQPATPAAPTGTGSPMEPQAVDQATEPHDEQRPMPLPEAPAVQPRPQRAAAAAPNSVPSRAPMPRPAPRQRPASSTTAPRATFGRRRSG